MIKNFLKNLKMNDKVVLNKCQEENILVLQINVDVYQRSMTDLSVKALWPQRVSKCQWKHVLYIIPFSSLTYPLSLSLIISLPPSLCVAYCETDGEGKDDRQTEGRREREAENDKVGKWETISRRRETEKQGGSRCVKHKTTLWSLRLVLGWLRSNPRSLSLCTSEAAWRPLWATLGIL